MAPPNANRLSWQQRVTETIVHLTDILVMNFDVMELLQTIVERSIDLLAAEDGGFMLADRQGQLRLLSVSSADLAIRQLFDDQAADGPCLDCYRTGQQVLNVTPSGMLTNWPRFGPVAAAKGYRYLHAFPVQYGGWVFGAMNLLCMDKNPLSPDGVTLGQGFADIAAMGLLHTRGDNNRKTQSEQLQSALHARTAIDQATGALAEQRDISLDDAFIQLRELARGDKLTLEATANAVVRHPR